MKDSSQGVIFIIANRIDQFIERINRVIRFLLRRKRMKGNVPLKAGPG